jgi:Flp pilus assembly protein TadD
MRQFLPLLALCMALGCGQRRARLNTLPPDKLADPVGVRMDLIEVLLDQGRTGAALQLVTTLRSEGVDSPELSVVEGRAMRAAGLATEATAILAEVVAAHPDHGEAWAELAVIHLAAEDLDRALPALHRAIELLPHDANVHNNLGFAQLAAGQRETAVETLRAGLRIAPGDLRIRTNLAFALLAHGQPAEALELFRANGTEADAQYNLGVGLEMGGKLDEARTAYTAALAADAKHPHSLEALARLSPPPEVIP